MDTVGTPRDSAFIIVGVAVVMIAPTRQPSGGVGISAVGVDGAALEVLKAALAQGWALPSPTRGAATTLLHDSSEEQAIASLRSIPIRDVGDRVQRIHDALTPREREVLCLLAGGATNRAIASRLFISPKTASVHVSRILTKLDASSRTEAAALAHASGLVRPEDIGQLAAG